MRPGMAAPHSMEAVWSNTEVLKLIGGFLSLDGRGEIQLLGLLSITEIGDRQYRWNLWLEFMERRELEHRRRMLMYGARRRSLMQAWTHRYHGEAPYYFVQVGLGSVRRRHPPPGREDWVDWL